MLSHVEKSSEVLCQIGDFLWAPEWSAPGFLITQALHPSSAIYAGSPRASGFLTLPGVFDNKMIRSPGSTNCTCSAVLSATSYALVCGLSLCARTSSRTFSG